MAAWLPFALTAGMVCFLIFALAYVFLYATYRTRALLLWSCGWFCHSLRNLAIL